MKLNNPLKDSNNTDNNWANYFGLGLQLAATVAIMVFIGVWLDGKFKTEPIFTIVFSFLGIISGLYNFLKTVLKS